MNFRQGSLISFGLLFALTACSGEGLLKVQQETSSLSEFLPAEPANAANGRWGRLFDWPIIPIHWALTPEGKIFSYGTNGNGDQGAQFQYDIWTPTGDLNAHQVFPNTQGTDIFCGALGVLPNGDTLIPGGDQRNPVNVGIADTLVLNRAGNQLTRQANMQFARWYPTLTTLPSGEMMIFGGYDGGKAPVQPAEIYNNGQWRTAWGTANGGIINDGEGKWFYPRNWVAPNGRVFGITGDVMYFLDWAGNGGNQIAGNIPNKTRSHTSTAVMYQPGKILQVGGSTNGDTQAPGSNQAITVDVSGGWPVVQNVENMKNAGRVWANSTVMANGEVLVTGGTQFENKDINAAKMAEIWNPNTRQFRNAVPASTSRMYHSNAILLPDGSVLTGGGGAPGPLNNKNAEIYYPGYLFQGNGQLAPRHNIGDFNKNGLQYNTTINVPFQGNGGVTRVTLVRTGAVTHSFDVSQRFMDLGFQNQGGSVNVNLPQNPNLAPPGFYMLFIFNEQGVPSVAPIVQLGAGNANNPPVVNPPVNGGDAPAQGVNFQVVNAASNKCLDLDNGNAANGTVVHQWDCNPNSINQRWRVQASGNGTFNLIHAGTGKCVDVAEISQANGMKVHQWECPNGGGNNQKVRFAKSIGGGFSAKFEHSNKCLDLNAGSGENGAKIQQWDCNNAAAQSWKFVP